MNAIELNHACTYATPEELYWLTAWAKDKQNNHIEGGLVPFVSMIGAGPGVMAVALFDGCEFIAIDVFDITSCAYVREHVRQTHPSSLERAKFYEMDSRLGPIENRAIDLLIVDGDHSYEGVKRDLDAWIKHVKPNGLVFLHDYDADGTCFAGVERYPGVKQAIEECSAHWEEYARVGTAMVMKVLA